MRVEEKYIIPIIIIGFLFFFFMFKVSFHAGKVIEEPHITSECSIQEIEKAWKSIFEENSEDLIIRIPSDLDYNLSELQESNITCPVYTAYKINNGNEIKALYETNGWFFVHMRMIIAINGKISPERLENLTNSEKGLSPSDFLEVMGENLESNESTNRGIENATQAKEKFESIFKVNSNNWEKEIAENGTSYSFSEEKLIQNVTLFGKDISSEDGIGEVSKAGMVFQNKSLEIYIFNQNSIYNMAYIKKYENWTSPINTSLKNIEIKINNSELDFLTNYEEVQKVQILDKNKIIVESNLNFTKELDFTKVNLKKQNESDEKGYIIINGINNSKNVTVDKLNNNSNSVCIKDQEINSIDEITENCTGQNEYIIKCPGNSSGFTCTLVNGSFFVTGLNHSAVIEFTLSNASNNNSEPEECIPNWECGPWTNSENNCGTRECLDSNNCGNTTLMPEDQKECPVICTPEWECSEWAPEKCPKEKEQKRICRDANDCGTNENVPKTSQTCERENKTAIIIIVGVLIILIILVFLLIIKFSNKK